MADIVDDNSIDNYYKAVFAEDVVILFLSEVFETSYVPSFATPHREIYKVFNEQIKLAMFDMWKRIKMYRMVHEINEICTSRRQFKQFAERLRKRFFYRGFDAYLFLFYCVHLAVTSISLADFIELQEAGDLAVQCILEGLVKYNMLHGGWDTLNVVAEKMNRGEDYVETNTPEHEIVLEGINLGNLSSADEDTDATVDTEESDDSESDVFIDDANVDNKAEVHSICKITKHENAEYNFIDVEKKEVEEAFKNDCLSEESSRAMKSISSDQSTFMVITSSKDASKAEHGPVEPFDLASTSQKNTEHLKDVQGQPSNLT